MELVDIVMTVTEIIGIISCAISGSLISIDRKLDAFGVIFIGCISAFGGGLIRDIIIGKELPAVFTNVHILGIAAVTSLITFIVVYVNRKPYLIAREKIDSIINVFDSVGLGAFTIIGTETAKFTGFYNNIIFTVFLGCITGIGGGMLRDIITNVTPYVLRKHIYAIASVLGSITFYLTDIFGVQSIVSAVSALIVVVTVRLLATKYRWSLPKIKNNDE